MTLFRSSGVGALMTDPRAKKDKEAGVLSASAKTLVEDTWRLINFGYRKDIKNKYLSKGNDYETDSIARYNKVFNTSAVKNTERRSNKFITGECDIITKDTVIDVKTSWDLKTFMDGELTPLYEYQLRCYMELWNVDKAVLAYCLVDAKSEIVEKEQGYITKDYDNVNGDTYSDEAFDNLARDLKQVETNLILGDKLTDKQRVRTFEVTRDKSIISELYDRITKAREYYNTIKL